MLQSLKTFLLVSGIVLVGMAAGFAQNGNTNHTEFATLGGGCFWCMDAVFKLLPGVKSITSGYAGGHTENPTYDQVSTGDTGHAEVIQIEFDPQKISYDKLLYYFWEAHDPTTLNRQGADTGTQYRSIILYQSEKQKLLAEKSKLEAQKKFHSPIVTEIVPLKKFYRGEAHHQDYYENNSDQLYSQAVIRPKVEKIKKELKKAAP
jgi:peptide-methionine (S)-S-oxide reductase